LYINDNA